MSVESPRITRGSCLCGDVRFEIRGPFSYAMVCHCSQCRRATGSNFKPFAGVPIERFWITQGEDLRMYFGDATTHDARCKRCGSLLYSKVQEGTMMHVTLGTLCDDPGISPQKHIFVGSKAPWDEITDDLPQHDGFPPSSETP